MPFMVLKEAMSARAAVVSYSTLFGRATRVCPRCDGSRVHAIGSLSVERVFDWYECRDCSRLWAVPYAAPGSGVAEEGQ